MALINVRNAGKMSQIKQPHALTAERPFPRAPGAQVKATKRLSRSKGWSLVGSCGCSACDRGLIAAIAGAAFGWLVLILGLVVFIIGRFQ
jgi:hypothetical protein